ncbi:MAG: EAL domain-containing protein [Pseudomonadota bacterium]
MAKFSKPVEQVQYTALSPEEQEQVLLLQQAVLEEVALGQDPIRVVENICRLAEAALPNSVATCMLLNDAGDHLDVLAAPSVPAEAIARLNGLCPGPGAGSCGNAVYRQEPVYVENTFVDARWHDIRLLARDFNIGACWSMPIRSAGGRVLGSFALSSFEHRLPSSFHRKLLEIGAHLIGITLARQESDARIAFLASHDALTGLPSRALVRDRLAQAVARAQRERRGGALLFIDLDNFKLVNDSLGHHFGDLLLERIAGRLKSCVRDCDSIGRQGGDEFLMVLADVEGTEAVSVLAEKVLDSMGDPFQVEGHELTASLSMGIAVFPGDGTDPDMLIRKADAAMYHAKDAGRNTYRYFTERMNVDSAEHLALRNDLRRALEQGEFVLHYQPQLRLADGAVLGVEALIRWHHPRQGLMAPGRFIPIAEACGLIVPLGEWVLGEACRQAAAWQARGLTPLVVAVNLSPIQFRRGNLEAAVAGALSASGLEARWLELEITESVLMHDTGAMTGLIQGLKGLGVKLSIDDFGTGYSSLAYLKRLKVDKLKIDQSFVRDMESDEEDAGIVRAVIQMARGLHLATVAEGVETAGAADMLRAAGCDEVQGYHYARPLPAHDLEAWLSAR